MRTNKSPIQPDDESGSATNHLLVEGVGEECGVENGMPATKRSDPLEYLRVGVANRSARWSAQNDGDVIHGKPLGVISDEGKEK